MTVLDFVNGFHINAASTADAQAPSLVFVASATVGSHR
jgi:hypothetical protein